MQNPKLKIPRKSLHKTWIKQSSSHHSFLHFGCVSPPHLPCWSTYCESNCGRAVTNCKATPRSATSGAPFNNAAGGDAAVSSCVRSRKWRHEHFWNSPCFLSSFALRHASCFGEVPFAFSAFPIIVNRTHFGHEQPFNSSMLREIKELKIILKAQRGLKSLHNMCFWNETNSWIFFIFYLDILVCLFIRFCLGGTLYVEDWGDKTTCKNTECCNPIGDAQLCSMVKRWSISKNIEVGIQQTIINYSFLVKNIIVHSLNAPCKREILKSKKNLCSSNI